MSGRNGVRAVSAPPTSRAAHNRRIATTAGSPSQTGLATDQEARPPRDHHHPAAAQPRRRRRRRRSASDAPPPAIRPTCPRPRHPLPPHPRSRSRLSPRRPRAAVEAAIAARSRRCARSRRRRTRSADEGERRRSCFLAYHKRVHDSLMYIIYLQQE